jgi:hypothetical protein
MNSSLGTVDANPIQAGKRKVDVPEGTMPGQPDAQSNPVHLKELFGAVTAFSRGLRRRS